MAGDVPGAPAAPAAPAARAARLKALEAAGALARYHGDHAASDAFWREGLALARALGDRPARVRALHGLALVALAAGDAATARARFEESLAGARGLGNPPVSETLAMLALVAQAQGDRERARARFEEALRGRPTNAALWGRFYLAVEDGDFARARALEPALAARGRHGPQRRHLPQRAGGAGPRGGRARPGQGALRRKSGPLARRPRPRGDRLPARPLRGPRRTPRADPQRAARLAGAAGEQHALHGGPLNPILQACLERLLQRASRSGGPRTPRRAQEGRAMTLAQAVAYALEDAPPGLTA